MRLLALRLHCLVAILPVGPAAALLAQDPDREIRREVRTYLDLLGRRDLEGVVARYSPGAEPASLGDGDAAEGLSEVRALYREFFEAAGRARLVPDSVHVVPLGPGGALAWFRFRWVGGGEGGGVMTLVYRREGSRWVIVHDHMSLTGATPVEAERDEARYDGPARPRLTSGTCVVTRISDGDSLECGSAGRIRLIGVDAPELSQNPHGTAAKAALARLIPPGTTVTLEPDSTLRDRYGRQLAYLWIEGQLVNWRLVREGWALAYRYEPDVRWAGPLELAEGRAREERRGLWATDGFSCVPGDRRRGRC